MKLLLIIIHILSYLLFTELTQALKEKCTANFVNICMKANLITAHELITPEDEQFWKLNNKLCNRKPYIPSAILLVSNNREVQIAVKCFKKLQCPFAIKSGGGSYENFSTGGDGYIVLDLRKLNFVKFNRQTMTVDIGSGNNVKHLVKNLEKQHNVTVGSGVSYMVGISGLALGGGWSFFSRKNGLLVQNVLEMTIVDANGDIIITNATHNNDLFTALLGAGASNFGIVTRFKLRAFHANHSLISVELSTSFNNFVQFYDQWQQLVLEDDASISSFIFFTRDSIGIISVVNNEDISVSRMLAKKLKDHFSIPDITHEVYEYNFVDMYTHFQRYLENVQGMQKAKSFFVDKAITSDEIKKLYASIKTLAEPFENVLIECVQWGAAIKQSNQHTSYIHSNNLYTFEVYSFENDTLADQSIAAIANFMTDVTFLDSGYTYQNIIDEDLDIGRYYGHMIPFLMHVKCKYDSENFFNYPQSIPVPHYCGQSDRHTKKCSRLTLPNMYLKSEAIKTSKLLSKIK